MKKSNFSHERLKSYKKSQNSDENSPILAKKDNNLRAKGQNSDREVTSAHFADV